MIVDIFSDPICPWCFIGKKRLAQALDLRPDAPVTVRWRAFQLNPDMPPAGMDRQAYLSAKFGGADRAGQIYDRIRQVGENGRDRLCLRQDHPKPRTRCRPTG